MRCPFEGCGRPTALDKEGQPKDPGLFRSEEHLDWDVKVETEVMPDGSRVQRITVSPRAKGETEA